MGWAFPGPPQPGCENGSDWLPGSLFCDSFRSSLGPPSQIPKMVQNGFLGSFFITVLGSSQPSPKNSSDCVFLLVFGASGFDWKAASRKNMAFSAQGYKLPGFLHVLKTGGQQNICFYMVFGAGAMDFQVFYVF